MAGKLDRVVIIGNGRLAKATLSSAISAGFTTAYIFDFDQPDGLQVTDRLSFRLLDAHVSSGQLTFPAHGSEQLELLRSADLCVVAFDVEAPGTRPEYRPLLDRLSRVIKALTPETPILIQSDLYPGAMESVVIPFLNRSSDTLAHHSLLVGSASPADSPISNSIDPRCLSEIPLNVVGVVNPSNPPQAVRDFFGQLDLANATVWVDFVSSQWAPVMSSAWNRMKEATLREVFHLLQDEKIELNGGPRDPLSLALETIHISTPLDKLPPQSGGFERASSIRLRKSQGQFLRSRFVGSPAYRLIRRGMLDGISDREECLRQGIYETWASHASIHSSKKLGIIGFTSSVVGAHPGASFNPDHPSFYFREMAIDHGWNVWGYDPVLASLSGKAYLERSMGHPYLLALKEFIDRPLESLLSNCCSLLICDLDGSLRDLDLGDFPSDRIVRYEPRHIRPPAQDGGR